MAQNPQTNIFLVMHGEPAPPKGNLIPGLSPESTEAFKATFKRHAAEMAGGLIHGYSDFRIADIISSRARYARESAKAIKDVLSGSIAAEHLRTAVYLSDGHDIGRYVDSREPNEIVKHKTAMTVFDRQLRSRHKDPDRVAFILVTHPNVIRAFAQLDETATLDLTYGGITPVNLPYPAD